LSGFDVHLSGHCIGSQRDLRRTRAPYGAGMCRPGLERRRSFPISEAT
jgi:hypothetical protein